MIVDTQNTKIKTAIKKGIDTQNISIAELARKSGVSKRSIFSILAGESLREHTTQKILKALGYSLKVEYEIKISKDSTQTASAK